MTDAVLRDGVKEQLGISTNDTLVNSNIQAKAIAVKLYLIKAGAKQMVDDPITNENAISDIDVACIAIGVNDLLNNKAGETKFSPAFNILALQICRG